MSDLPTKVLVLDHFICSLTWFLGNKLNLVRSRKHIYHSYFTVTFVEKANRLEYAFLMITCHIYFTFTDIQWVSLLH